MASGLGSVISFLTIIPSPGAQPEETAKSMHLFPVVGAIIGLAAGALGLGLSMIVDPLLAGVLVAAFIAVITGMHHLDALADFADGLMAHGGKARRLEAMRDRSVGSAGVAGVVLCTAGLVAAASLAGGTDLLRGLLVSEILAKFSMVLAASLGAPAAPGSGAVFAGVMRDKRKLAAAAAITLVPVALLGGVAWPVMLGCAILVAAAAVAVSGRAFGGITGDVLGAVNELARVASLAVFVSV